MSRASGPKEPDLKEPDPKEPGPEEPGPKEPGPKEPGPGPTGDAPAARLPVMPGFREIAARRMAGEQAARMAEGRARLVRELAGQRQASGLSQTEVAALMGTSQSAVARLESGATDVRASTLERYAAAVGGQITWEVNRQEEGASG